MADDERYEIEVTEHQEREFARPPIKEWILAELDSISQTKGKYQNTGFSFQFRVVDDDPECKDVGSVWGTAWTPASVGRPLHEWCCALAGRELEPGEKPVLQDYIGATVEVFVEEDKKVNPKTGHPYINVTDVRIPKTGAKARGRRSEDGDGTEAAPAAAPSQPAKSRPAPAPAPSAAADGPPLTAGEVPF